MRELKKFYWIIEILFFGWWFLLFLCWLFLKNDFYWEIVKLLFLLFNLPFIWIAITYWLLSLKLKMEERVGQSDVFDWFLLISWCSFFIMLLFVFLAYPDKI